MLLFAVRNDIMEIVQSKRIAFDIKRKVHNNFVVNGHFASFDKSFVGAILCVLFNIICMRYFGVFLEHRIAFAKIMKV